MTSAVVNRVRRRALPLGLAALGLLGALGLFAWLPFSRLQQWLGPERALAVALGRARLVAGGRGLCVLLGDSRVAALGDWHAECHVVNLGRPGSSAARWRSWLPTLDRELPRDAQLAVWLGVNDLLHRHAPAEHVARDLVALLRGLAHAERTVHVLPQLAVFVDAGWAPGELNAASRSIDAQLRRELGGLRGVRFVEPAALGVGPSGPGPAFYRDGLHPGDAANARLRATLTQAFQPGHGAP